jgi:hypothetical protein
MFYFKKSNKYFIKTLEETQNKIKKLKIKFTVLNITKNLFLFYDHM